MSSHDFFIDTSGPIIKLRKALVDAKLGGDTRMVRSYNRHGCEAYRVVQITCDREVEPEFLRRMRRARILSLPPDVDPLELLPANPACGPEREKLTREHLDTRKAQWKQCAEAGKNEHTRRHFFDMMPMIKERIVRAEADKEAQSNRANTRAALARGDGEHEGRRVDI